MGIWIGILGLLGVVVTLVRDPKEIGKREKAIWIALLFAFLFLEMKSVYQDRNEHDEAERQSRERSEQNFGAIANGVQGAINGLNITIAEGRKHFDETVKLEREGIDQITGGNSYIVVDAVSNPKNPEDNALALYLGICAKCVDSVSARIAASPVVVCAKDAAFHQAKESFDCIRRDVSPVLIAGIFLFLVRHNVMVRKLIMHEVVDVRFVGLNYRSNFDVLFHNRFDVVQRHTLNGERAHAPAIGATFHQRNNGALLAFGMSSTTEASTLFLRPNPNFVNFNHAAQLLNHAVLRHSEAETMAREPNRLVANPRHTVNLVGRHSLFAGAHEVRDQEPAMQRNVTTFKNGSHGCAELFAASITLPHALANGLLGIGAGL